MKKTLLTYLALFAFILGVNSQTTFDSKVTIDSDTGDNPYILDSGDLDGDGDMDIVLGTYDYFGDTAGDVIKWYRNNGIINDVIDFDLVETVSSTTALETMTLIGGLKIYDVDGINGNDIVATSADENKVVWFENDGNGNFADAVVLWSGLVGAGQIAIADINKDLIDDICIVVFGDAATGTIGNKVIWYPSNGDGTFGTEQLIDDTMAGPGSINFDYFEIESDDDNESNEDLDAVISSTYGGDIKVFYNQFIEDGSSIVSWDVDTNTVDTGNTYVFVAAFHDYNDDGQLDILKSNTDNIANNLAWYNQEGDGTYTENSITCSLSFPAIAKMADLNDDGFTDLVVTNGITNGDDVVWFESTGAGTYFPEAAIDNSQKQVFGITGADFDGDGDIDIATVDFQEFDLNIFINNKYTLNVDSFDQEKISIYPNPTSDVLNFKGLTNENYKVSIYDILGKEIMEVEQNTNSSLDVSKLQVGVYFLKFNDFNKTYKFIKE